MLLVQQSCSALVPDIMVHGASFATSRRKAVELACRVEKDRQNFA
jgi:hypothetical protein